MNAVIVLTGRNLRLYFGDKLSVFFSLLSPLILIALYVLFLGRLQLDSLRNFLPAANSEQIRWFVDSWTVAGITMITTVTAALAPLNTFIEDQVSGRFRDFLVSPIRRWQLILAYIWSSFMISVIMSVLVAVIGQGYLLVRGQTLMSFAQLAEGFAWIVLSSAAFAALSSTIVSLLKSTGAFAALSIIVGTLIGFLAGAYLPVGVLPTTVVNVLNALPFANAAMLIRGPFMRDALETLTGGAGHDTLTERLELFYGLAGSVGDWQITTATAAGMLAVVAVAFTALSAWRLSRKIW